MIYYAFQVLVLCLDLFRAGGVALYISSDYLSKRREDLEHSDFELLFVEVKINSLTFVCGVCYRPPNYNSIVNNALLDHLQFCLDEINKIPGTFVLLFGDFNADFVMLILPNNDFGSYLYRWLECNGLFQVINEPTRITAHSATLLDLIITNSPGYFVNSGAISPPSNCDHSLVYARMSVSLEKQKCYTRHIWDYSKIDENALREVLVNAAWDEIYNVDDVVSYTIGGFSVFIIFSSPLCLIGL